MRVIGYWLGLWDIVYVGGRNGNSWLRIVRKNVFGEKYCVIELCRQRLNDDMTVTGASGERWMHYKVLQRLAACVIESLQGCTE